MILGLMLINGLKFLSLPYTYKNPDAYIPLLLLSFFNSQVYFNILTMIFSMTVVN